MLTEVDWPDERSYRSNSEDEPLQFYLEALTNSNRMDLLLGYFSSAAIHVLAIGFANFLYRGGNVRMVINNVLSKEDKGAINMASEEDLQNLNHLDLTDIKAKGNIK